MELAKELNTVSLRPELRCCICQHLLTEPLQLDCLHNCCRRCADLEKERAQEGSRASVTCPVCRHVTDACALVVNGFLDRELRLHGALLGTGVCDFCIEDGLARMPPVTWCMPCGKSLCDECAVGHSRFASDHVTRTLDDLRSSNDLTVSRRPPVEAAGQCREHDEPYQYGCLTCDKALCSICRQGCIGAAHDVHSLRESPFEDRVRKLSESMLRLKGALQEKSAAVKSRERLADRMDAAREDHLNQMMERKRRVLDAVEQAYNELEHTADRLYDRLRSDAQHADESAAALGQLAEYAHSYCSCLLEANATCDMVNQQARLRTRLEWLCAEMDRTCRLESSVDATLPNAVAMQYALPDNLEDVIKRWIGGPQPGEQGGPEAKTEQTIATSGEGVTCSPAANTEQTVASAREGVTSSPVANTEQSVATSGEGVTRSPAANTEQAVASRAGVTSSPAKKTEQAVASSRVGVASSPAAKTEQAVASSGAGVTSSPAAKTGQSVADSTAESGPGAAARFRFGRASVIVRLPIACWDATVTADGGRLLLAADALGLLECSTRGQQLGGWRPPKRTNGQPDAVSTVQLLDDGRAVVGVRYSRLVVLLRRAPHASTASSAESSRSALSDDTWVEDCRLPILQSPPWRVAVCGHSLALAECRFDRQLQTWVSGRVVRLIDLSAGDGATSSSSKSQSPPVVAAAVVLPAVVRSRDYDVWGLALTDRLVITTSCDAVRLATGRPAHVVDAHSRSSDQRLWRYAAGNDEGLEGICSDVSGRYLYLAAGKRDASGGRVMAVSADDGSEVHARLLHFGNSSLLPVWPSLHRAVAGEQTPAVLAVVCYDPTSEQTRTVIAYPTLSTAVAATTAAAAKTVASATTTAAAKTAAAVMTSAAPTTTVAEKTAATTATTGCDGCCTDDADTDRGCDDSSCRC